MTKIASQNDDIVSLFTNACRKLSLQNNLFNNITISDGICNVQCENGTHFWGPPINAYF